MSHVKMVRLVLIGVLALGILAVIGAKFSFSGSTYAQNITNGNKQEAESSGQRAPADVPSGYSAIYVFPGARDDAAVPGTSSGTAVHCTNLGIAIVNVHVEFADFDYSPVYSGTYSLAPNYTATITSRDTAVYSEDLIINADIDSINQGFGRVSVDNNQPVICTAQVLDPTNNPPNFIVNLDIFTP